MKSKLFTIAIIFLFLNTGFAQSGGLDLSFDPGTGAEHIVSATVIQPDGKIIIVGEFTSYNGTSRNHIARIHPDGSLDTSFDPGTGANMYGIWAVAVQSDGKIIIGGDFYTYNGTTIFGVARLNSDGSLDASFNSGLEYESVSALTIQSDGKIIIGGSFYTYDDLPRKGIARLNTDGSVDTSFDPGAGTNNNIRTFSIQPDGKILIAGQFSSYDNTSRNYIARLNTNGSLDTSFDPQQGAEDYIYTCTVQPDGKILIGGRFDSYNGTDRLGIARIHPDGILDTSFDPGTATDNANYGNVYATATQQDGKIIVVGEFSSFNGTPRENAARLNTDGSLDVSFEVGTGASNFNIKTAAIQPDGRIIIGGNFFSFNDVSRVGVARLHGSDPAGIAEMNADGHFVVYPNPFSEHALLRSDDPLQNATLTIYNLVGEKVHEMGGISGEQISLSRDDLTGGTYFIRLSENGDVIGTSKIVIVD